MVIGLYHQILRLVRTIRVNYALFGVRGVKIRPILVNQKLDVKQLQRGTVEIQCAWKKGLIELGTKGTPFVQERETYLAVTGGGKIIFHGSCVIAQGYRIFVNGGCFEVGQGVYINKNLTVQCEKSIVIGNGDLFGWNVAIRDTDGHPIVKSGEVTQFQKPVSIAENVWIAADCTILKGAFISAGSVVGCNSLVSGRKFEQPGCVIAGVPAKVVSENILWEN